MFKQTGLTLAVLGGLLTSYDALALETLRIADGSTPVQR